VRRTIAALAPPPGNHPCVVLENQRPWELVTDGVSSVHPAPALVVRMMRLDWIPSANPFDPSTIWTRYNLPVVPEIRGFHVVPPSVVNLTMFTVVPASAPPTKTPCVADVNHASSIELVVPVV
jgi:hypothetical protein